MDALDRYESIVDDYDAFREACLRPLPATVRVNTIKATPERVIAALEAAGVTATQRSWEPTVLAVDTAKPGNTWPYVHGWIHGQEEVSAIPPMVLDPRPGEVVWAAAAAPGSKATQLAALMDDTGLVIANDDNLDRLSALRGNADRLGVTSMAVTNEDARFQTFDPFGIDRVDRALVDAPCTCEGTVRKSPDALDGAGPASSTNIANVQRDILAHAVAKTKSGGTVVYSTCTFAPEENEAVVDAVLAGGDATVVPFEVPLEHTPGLTEWQSDTYADALAATKRFYPHQNDTGGFYVAKLEVTR
ncbi:16S rRNA C967 or C1407 C5-methylase, RsmB/RsmF family [Halanaeroarchaeum sp. HSR-CO]|uniref:RsmB/NOP family class I SAM-dependent RNA methyltransferase n=1 Tax=Halanaeroarchaeum sp. HSR-CO TaxID=2866382 RepID=UPI00217EE471|nr:RsmB/NOP family class I SAM-dependent RNA methyltransferase [Halanaeroarchaeum sp. HSR-CO]UWG47405.1 16S rRNA C967 or C1407 C5-methylase, RsmB/RsmF family [Halanaeroarchaeum sp. HSR-CO]